MKITLGQICRCAQGSTSQTQRSRADQAVGPIEAAMAYMMYALLKTRNSADAIMAFCQAMQNDLESGGPNDPSGICLHRCNRATNTFGGPLAKYAAAAIKATQHEVFYLPNDWVPQKSKKYPERAMFVSEKTVFVKQLDEDSGAVTSRDPQRIYCSGDDSPQIVADIVERLAGCLDKPRNGNRQVLHEKTKLLFQFITRYYLIEKIRQHRTPWYVDLVLFDSGHPASEFSSLVLGKLHIDFGAGMFPPHFSVHIDWRTPDNTKILCVD